MSHILRIKCNDNLSRPCRVTYEYLKPVSSAYFFFFVSVSHVACVPIQIIHVKTYKLCALFSVHYWFLGTAYLHIGIGTYKLTTLSAILYSWLEEESRCVSHGATGLQPQRMVFLPLFIGFFFSLLMLHHFFLF